jgi:hypothetical protein
MGSGEPKFGLLIGEKEIRNLRIALSAWVKTELIFGSKVKLS